ncbi:carboxylate--amine ligase [Eggerthellaceae bacterium zg-887]|uniref:carboxylate--amine ligase n=1 Tax=Xiamenia xianingshaonis TaxID=2682776 RepID=UPI00140CEA05|nr:carboxylate--amine ligase [Xiamenia xianingshaonis]NHM15692.1 carboxylate--amine ligase [Xiamenia xianingshaonis]
MQSVDNQALTSQYLALVEQTDPAGDGRGLAWESMERGSAWALGHPAYFSYVPRLLNRTSRDQLAAIAETTHGILEKVIRAYLDDPAFRTLFRFDPRVHELIMASNACPDILPYGRFDCFFNETTGQARFVEFNADCSSGMNKTRESLLADAASAPAKAFCEARATESDIDELFGGWVRDFLDLYAGACENLGRARPEHPTIAIAVCLDADDVPLGELAEYARLFAQAGCECSVCDVRDFAFDENGRLSCENPLQGEPLRAVDAVWRFCIVVDLLAHWDECQPFLDAMRTGDIPLIGGFATQLVHDKQLFALLREPAVQALLTPDERAFVEASVPFTAFLDSPNLDLAAVKADPARWVIKPTDWYDSIGVYVGAEYSPEEWADVVDRCREQPGPSPYLVQEFCAIETTPVVPLYGTAADATAPVQEYGCLTGTYVHRGRFAGLYNRLGPNALVTDDAVCIVSPTLWCD